MDYTLIDIIAQEVYNPCEQFRVKDPFGKDIPIWTKYDFVNNNSQFILKAYAYTDPKNKLEIQAGYTDDSTTRFATFYMPDEVKLNLEEGRIYIEYDFTFDISNVVGYNKEYKLNGTIRTNYGIYNSSKSQLSSGSNNSYEVYDLQQTVREIYQEQLNKENNVTEEDCAAVIKKQYPGASWILEPSDMYNTNIVYVPADYFGKASGGHYFGYGGYRDFERYGNSYTPFTVKIDSNIAKIWHEGGHPDASPFGVNHVDLTVTYSDSDPDNPAYDLLGMLHTCNLFKECYNLERVYWKGTLNIYNNTDNMFYACSNLVHISVKNMGPITDSLHLNDTQLSRESCQIFINALTSSEYSGLPAWGETMKTLWLSPVVSLSDVDCSNVPEDWDVCDIYGNHLREQSMPEQPGQPEEPLPKPNEFVDYGVDTSYWNKGDEGSVEDYSHIVNYNIPINEEDGNAHAYIELDDETIRWIVREVYSDGAGTIRTYMENQGFEITEYEDSFVYNIFMLRDCFSRSAYNSKHIEKYWGFSDNFRPFNAKNSIFHIHVRRNAYNEMLNYTSVWNNYELFFNTCSYMPITVEYEGCPNFDYLFKRQFIEEDRVNGPNLDSHYMKLNTYYNDIDFDEYDGRQYVSCVTLDSDFLRWMGQEGEIYRRNYIAQYPESWTIFKYKRPYTEFCNNTGIYNITDTWTDEYEYIMAGAMNTYLHIKMDGVDNAYNETRMTWSDYECLKDPNHYNYDLARPLAYPGDTVAENFINVVCNMH